MRKCTLIGFLAILATITNSFAMNFFVKTSQGPYEKNNISVHESAHETLYSEKDLSAKLNIPIYPKTSKIESNKYSKSISTSTIHEKMLWTMTQFPNQETEFDTYSLVVRKAYEAKFGANRYPYYSEHFNIKNKKNKKLWECLIKTLKTYKVCLLQEKQHNIA